MQTLSVTDLPQYFHNITDRIEHHGSHWHAVVGAITLNVLANLDASAPIQCGTYNGKLTNRVRVQLKNGKEVKITYHPTKQEISVVEGATGRKLGLFTPSTDPDDIASVIRRASV